MEKGGEKEKGGKGEMREIFIENKDILIKWNLTL